MTFDIPNRRVLGRLLLAAALVAATACNDDNDPTDPDDIGGNVEGSWEAVSFAGALLPIQEYVLDPDRSEICLRELVSVDLLFAPAGDYTWDEETAVDCPSTSGPPEHKTATFTGTYRVDGVRLYMTDSEQGAEQQSTFSVKDNTLTMNIRVGSTVISSVFQRG